MDEFRESQPSSEDHAGHRDRLRARFSRHGPDALADYELLELALFRSLPRRDTKSIAKALLRKFGSVSGVIGANSSRLQEVNGVGASVATDLKIFHAIAERLGREAVRSRPVVGSWSHLLDYCRTAMAHEDREQFRILFLDKKNAIIADEVQQTGTVDHTPVYPREIVKRSLELSATALILVHNHPSGDPTPSQADIQMTKMIVDIAEPLGIAVHDHIIVGREGHASLKGLGII